MFKVGCWLLIMIVLQGAVSVHADESDLIRQAAALVERRASLEEFDRSSVPLDERSQLAIFAAEETLYQSLDFYRAKKLLEFAESRAALSGRMDEILKKVFLLRFRIASAEDDGPSTVVYGEKYLDLAADTVDLEFYINIATESVYAAHKLGNHSAAIRVTERVLARADELSKEVEAEFRSLTAQSQYRLGEFSAAEAMARESLSLFLELSDEKGVAYSYRILGNISLGIGELSKARLRYREAQKRYEIINDAHGIANSFFNIGLTFSREGQHDEAVKYFNISSVYFLISGSSSGAAMGYSNAANTYAKLADYRSAIKYFDSARRVLERSESFDRLAILEENVGAMYLKQGDNAAALVAYRRALELKMFIEETSGLERLREKIKDLSESR